MVACSPNLRGRDGEMGMLDKNGGCKREKKSPLFFETNMKKSLQILQKYKKFLAVEKFFVLLHF